MHKRLISCEEIKVGDIVVVFPKNQKVDNTVDFYFILEIVDDDKSGTRSFFYLTTSSKYGPSIMWSEEPIRSIFTSGGVLLRG